MIEELRRLGAEMSLFKQEEMKIHLSLPFEIYIEIIKEMQRDISHYLALSTKSRSVTFNSGYGVKFIIKPKQNRRKPLPKKEHEYLIRQWRTAPFTFINSNTGIIL